MGLNRARPGSVDFPKQRQADPGSTVELPGTEDPLKLTAALVPRTGHRAGRRRGWKGGLPTSWAGRRRGWRPGIWRSANCAGNQPGKGVHSTWCANLPDPPSAHIPPAGRAGGGHHSTHPLPLAGRGTPPSDPRSKAAPPVQVSKKSWAFWWAWALFARWGHTQSPRVCELIHRVPEDVSEAHGNLVD